MLRKAFFLFFFFSLVSCTSAQEESLQTKKFRVAMFKGLRDLGLKDKKDKIRAFSEDLIRQIEWTEDISIELFEIHSEADAAVDIQSGLYDAILAPSSLKGRSVGAYKFSEVYFHTGHLLIIRQEEALSPLSEYKNKIFSVSAGETFPHDVSLDRTVIFKQYEDLGSAVYDLLAHEIDGVIEEGIKARGYVSKIYQGRLKVHPEPISKEGLRMITAKSMQRQDLLKHFNRGLYTLKAKGVYQELLQKWGLGHGATTSVEERF